MIDLLVKSCPLIAGILYAVVGAGYFVRMDYAWSLVWISYALANLGLVLAASKGFKMVTLKRFLQFILGILIEHLLNTGD